MPANPSRTKLPFDVSAATLLRSPNTFAPLVGNSTLTGISLSELRTAYWSNFEIPHGVMRVGVVVQSIFLTGVDTYALSLVVDDLAAMSDAPVTVAGPWNILTNGYYEFDVDSKSIPQLHTVHTGPGKFMAVKSAVTGANIAITGVVIAGAPGRARVTVASTTGFINGQVLTISGVVGSVEINGTFAVTVFDATHFDILAVTAVTAYVSGGIIAPQLNFGAWIGKSTDA